MGPITHQKLEEVASWADEPSSTASQNGQPRAEGAFDMPAFIARASERLSLEIRGPHATAEGMEWKFSGCPFQPGYVDANAAVIQEPSGKRGFNCFCGDHPKKQWHDLRELVDGPKAGWNAGAEQARPASPVSQWPSQMDPEAFHGLAGDIVRTIEPHSEADAAGLLVQLLIGLGNAIGRGPCFRVGADLHYLNLFCVLVGQTSRGRKGSSWSAVSQLLAMVDEEWAGNCIQSGLSSGEGVIWAVRDPIEEEEPIRERKTRTVTSYQTVRTDPGVTDKRLLVLESEFASTLKVANRDGNTLSAMIRQAWDSGNLRVLTKTRPAKSTGAHISIIGHVTKDELLKYLTTTEAGNGFANRFLWVCVRRSKLLPEGGELHKVNMQPLIRRLDNAVRLGRIAGEMSRDQEAMEKWAAVYSQLSGNRLGLYGAVTTRAEAITLRLSCLYALLDGSAMVTQRHLTAALAVWKYCEDSARFVFGDAIGDETADRILQALRAAPPEGLTKTDINALFDRHKSSQVITLALNLLQSNGMVRGGTEETRGRPAERWYLVR